MNTSRLFKLFLPAALILTFALAFCFVQPVLAQDETTPVETPVEAPAADPLVLEAPPETPMETPAELPVVDPPAEETPLTEPDTVELVDVVLLDSSGEPLSMASQEAATVLGGDPYFVAGGVYYGFSATGVCPAIVLPINCTTSATPIQSAINDFATRHATGAITVEAGSYNETTITINGVTGLTGLFGAGSEATTGSVFTGATNISIQNQTAAFTLKGFRIQNGNYNGALVAANNNTGTLTLDTLYLTNANANGDAITVSSHTGAVNVIDVEADGNLDVGATISATGNVAVTNSSFDGNSGMSALSITSTTGSITLDGVSASDNNAGDGARLISKTGITIRNSMFRENSDGIVLNSLGNGLWIDSTNRGPVLIQNSYFNDNVGEDGLIIHTLSGAVTLNSVQVIANRRGLTVDTCQSSGSVCTGSGALTITNSIVNTNYNYNLVADIAGTITFTNVSASNSGAGYGAWLVSNHATSAYAVTVSNGTFSDNHGTGLGIQTKGAVTLNHVVANGNVGGISDGIIIDNTFGTAGVTLLATLGQNVADGNAGFGVQIVSKGSVTINNLSAWTNANRNLQIVNSTGTSGVTITTASLHDAFNENLYIESRGAISLTGVEAMGAINGYGANLHNEASLSRAGVTIKTSDFSNNHTRGLYIRTTGPIALTSVSAWNSTLGDGVYISATGSGAIAVTDATFINNFHNGLFISANGAITLKNINAQMNGWAGVDLRNFTSTSPAAISITNLYVSNNIGTSLSADSHGAVTITGINIYGQTAGTSGAVAITTTGAVTINNIGQQGSIDYNNGDNLTITSSGNVSITNLASTRSLTGRGVAIDNSGGTGTVTITNSRFESNLTDGIVVFSRGNITLTGVSAQNNINGVGANLGNTSSATAGITIGGTTTSGSTFSGNETYGVIIDSHGAVTLSYMTVENNHNAGNTNGNGVNMALGNGITNVTLSNLWVNNHPNYGLNIICSGTVTGTNIYAFSNGENIYIDNTSAAPATPRTVTLTGISLNNGGDNGLWVQSDGAITIRGINIFTQTIGYGARLINTSGTAGVSVSGISSTQHGNIQMTGMDGLSISTHGPVTISNLDFNTCHGNGMTIDQTTGTGAVNLLNVIAYGNNNHGIQIVSNGLVSLNNVVSTNNGLISLTGTGVGIDNHLGTGTVAVTASKFTGNYLSGLYILSSRAVTLTGVDARSNVSGYGVFVRNDYGSGGVSMVASTTVPNYLFENNSDNLRILTNGDVTISGLTTQGSVNGDGVFINNTTGTGKVTITNLYSGANNTGYGLWAHSHGAISLTNVQSKYNNAGIELVNTGGATAVPVTIVTAESISNTLNGLQVNTSGNVAVSRITVFDNMNSGANIVLVSAPTATVTVDRSSFNYNNNGGLNIVGGGNVTLNGITANDNYGNGIGVTVDNRGGGSTGFVSLLTTLGANTMSGNTWQGFYVRTNGAVIVNNLTASNNGEQGLNVDNRSGPGSVTLTNGVYNQNVKQGIYVLCSSPVTISNVQVFGNGIGTDLDGIYVETSADPVLIQNSQITGNARYGIHANIGAVLTVKKCLYFGNNRQTPLDLDPNIYLISPTTLVVIR